MILHNFSTVSKVMFLFFFKPSKFYYPSLILISDIEKCSSFLVFSIMVHS